RSYFQDAGVALYAYGTRAIAFVVYGDATVGGGTHPLQNPDGGKWPGGHSLPDSLGSGPQPWCLDGGTGSNGQQPGLTVGGGGGGVLVEAFDLLVMSGGYISANGAGGGEGDGNNNTGCCAGASAARATVGSGFGGAGAYSGGPGGRGGDGGSSALFPATAGG